VKRAALFVVAFAVPVSGAGGAKRLPRLTVAKREPIVIRGTAFSPRERVLVVVRASRRAAARVTADGRGTFSVRVWAAFRECEKLAAAATGNRGSHASLVIREACSIPAATP
jgi:hypothetical protein